MGITGPFFFALNIIFYIRFIASPTILTLLAYSTSHSAIAISHYSATISSPFYDRPLIKQRRNKETTALRREELPVNGLIHEEHHTLHRQIASVRVHTQVEIFTQLGSRLSCQPLNAVALSLTLAVD